FNAEQDIVLKKLALSDRQLTLDAAAKSNAAIPSAETRLRAANYRVDRGPVEVGAEGFPGYTVSVTGVLQRAEAAQSAEGASP
ncbi:MAG: hypothetical protein IT424_00220, partial [Pirellulales bacterium]|nr:hypothetical protein [Pirellulales bacterium]